MNNYTKIVIVLTVVSVVCGAVLSAAYNHTKENIALAYRLDFISSLSAVLPAYDNYPDEDILFVDDKKVYVAKKGGEVVGYCAVFSSNKGYSGLVDVIVGIDLSGKVSGVFVLQHKETPGLGDKITDSEFLSAFKGLSNPNVIAVKKDGGIIDQFSGATMSPRAVAEAVREALSFFRKNFVSEEVDEVK